MGEIFEKIDVMINNGIRKIKPKEEEIKELKINMLKLMKRVTQFKLRICRVSNNRFQITASSGQKWRIYEMNRNVNMPDEEYLTIKIENINELLEKIKDVDIKDIQQLNRLFIKEFNPEVLYY